MSKEAPPSYEASKHPPGPQSHPVHNMGPAMLPLVMGPNSMSLTCPACHQPTITTINVTPNTKTHLLALLLCAIGCICCFWIPYATDSCMSKKHYCSRCNAYLGVYSD